MATITKESNVLLVSKESGQHLLAALQTGLLTTRAFGALQSTGYRWVDHAVLPPASRVSLLGAMPFKDWRL